jgi:hypothetical protein
LTLWLAVAAAQAQSVPAITAVEAPPFALRDTEVRVEATITHPVTALAGATLSFRRSGDGAFLSFDMERGADDRWSATVPAFVVADRGIDYFITATGISGDVTTWPPFAGGFLSVPSRLTDGLTLDIPAGSAVDGYRLRSIPGQPDNTSVESVLIDDLGPYDATRWRLFGERAASGAGYPFVSLLGISEQDEPPPSSGSILLEPGFAFWILSRDAARFNTGSLTAVQADSPPVRLLNPGWNLVSNPFAFALPASHVTVASATVDNPVGNEFGTELPPGETAPSGRVEAYRYDGVWSEYTGDWIPGEGYAVHNSGTVRDTLMFNADFSVPLAALAAKLGAGSAWRIMVTGTQGKARDENNVAVLAESASVGWDPMDRPEPPAVGDYVSVSFVGERFPLSVDARPAAGAWRLVVSSAKPGPVVLGFDVPAGVAAYLFDPATGASQDLALDPDYIVASAGGGFERHLELRSALETPEIAPMTFGLAPAFPNPSAGAVTLNYVLLERAQVELAVFDLLGRRMASLDSGARQAGSHALVWDTRDIPPGLYVVRLSTPSGPSAVTVTVAR